MQILKSIITLEVKSTNEKTFAKSVIHVFLLKLDDV